jgi:hypothetical protein
MQRVVLFGLAAAIATTVTGCGVAARTMPTVKAGAVAAKDAGPLSMKAAFDKVVAHTKATYGDDFHPVAVFGEKAFDKDAVAQPITWRFNMVGHLRGKTAPSFLKVQVTPEGQAFVDPKRGGPFACNNHDDTLAPLDVAGAMTPEAGWALVASDFALKFRPKNPISYKFLYNERLKHTVLSYTWNATRIGEPGSNWYAETCLDPFTGEIVENDASHD